MKPTKPDIFVIITLIAVAVFFMFGEKGGEKRLYLISDKGKERIEMKTQQIELDGGDVILDITPEGGRFLESDCPNKICILAGWVKDCGDTAVCVPNKYALVMECREAEYDAVSE